MTKSSNFTVLTPSEIAKAEREARLAERLRANLRRRKDVARKHKKQNTSGTPSKSGQ